MRPCLPLHVWDVKVLPPHRPHIRVTVTTPDALPSINEYINAIIQRDVPIVNFTTPSSTVQIKQWWHVLLDSSQSSATPSNEPSTSFGSVARQILIVIRVTTSAVVAVLTCILIAILHAILGEPLPETPQTPEPGSPCSPKRPTVPEPPHCPSIPTCSRSRCSTPPPKIYTNTTDSSGSLTPKATLQINRTEQYRHEGAPITPTRQTLIESEDEETPTKPIKPFRSAKKVTFNLVRRTVRLPLNSTLGPLEYKAPTVDTDDENSPHNSTKNTIFIPVKKTITILRENTASKQTTVSSPKTPKRTIVRLVEKKALTSDKTPVKPSIQPTFGTNCQNLPLKSAKRTIIEPARRTVVQHKTTAKSSLQATVAINNEDSLPKTAKRTIAQSVNRSTAPFVKKVATLSIKRTITPIRKASTKSSYQATVETDDEDSPPRPARRTIIRPSRKTVVLPGNKSPATPIIKNIVKPADKVPAKPSQQPTVETDDEDTREKPIKWSTFQLDDKISTKPVQPVRRGLTCPTSTASNQPISKTASTQSFNKGITHISERSCTKPIDNITPGLSGKSFTSTAQKVAAPPLAKSSTNSSQKITAPSTLKNCIKPVQTQTPARVAGKGTTKSTNSSQTHGKSFTDSTNKVHIQPVVGTTNRPIEKVPSQFTNETAPVKAPLNMTSFKAPWVSDLASFRSSIENTPEKHRGTILAMSEDVIAKLGDQDALHVWETDADLDNLLQLASVIAKLCKMGERQDKSIGRWGMVIIAEVKEGRDNFTRVCELCDHLIGVEAVQPENSKGTMCAFGGCIVVKGWDNARRVDHDPEAPLVVDRINRAINRSMKISGKKRIVWHHGPVVDFLSHWLTKTPSILRCALLAISVTSALDFTKKIGPSTLGKANKVTDLERLGRYARKISVPVVFLDASTQHITFNYLANYIYFCGYYLHTFLPDSLCRPHHLKALNDMTKFAYRIYAQSHGKSGHSVVKEIKENLEAQYAQTWTRSCLRASSYTKLASQIALSDEAMSHALHMVDCPFEPFESGPPKAFARLFVGPTIPPATTRESFIAMPIEIAFLKQQVHIVAPATTHILIPMADHDNHRITERIQGLMMGALERIRQEQGNPTIPDGDRTLWIGAAKSMLAAFEGAEAKLGERTSTRIKAIRENLHQGTWSFALPVKAADLGIGVNVNTGVNANIGVNINTGMSTNVGVNTNMGWGTNTQTGPGTISATADGAAARAFAPQLVQGHARFQTPSGYGLPSDYTQGNHPAIAQARSAYSQSQSVGGQSMGGHWMI